MTNIKTKFRWLVYFTFEYSYHMHKWIIDEKNYEGARSFTT